MISKNRIKYIQSLKLKKFRTESGQFVAEGDKIIRSFLQSGTIKITDIYAIDMWLSKNKNLLDHIPVVEEISANELDRICGQKTPNKVVALADIPQYSLDTTKLNTTTIVLDQIQDPGNLGTIIRTAGWFGIENIICSKNSVDAYNPKVVQSTMGALSVVKIHYAELETLIQEAIKLKIPVYGTFTDGKNIYNEKLISNGWIVFGNESSGISESIEKLVTRRIHIPAGLENKLITDSLNVSSSVAIVCSEFLRNSL